MKIFYHPQFRRSYEMLEVTIKLKAEKKEIMFRVNPFDIRLNTHKLHGKLSHLWSFSVDRRHRIAFEFIGKDVIFLAIGDHSLYT